jgi:hypothetical protein
MPIPAFDGILNALPPHLGNPTLPVDLSPYPCTTHELCERFADSPARKKILDGLLRLRGELLGLGVQGFQWLDGSFLENIEALEGRDPRDIDVVTFVSQPSDLNEFDAILKPRPDLVIRSQAKQAFFVDHFLIPLCSDAETIVDLSRYWYGLFSHRRDGTWKGMLRVALKAKADDETAWQVLRSKP